MFRVLVENGLSKFEGNISKCCICNLTLPEGEDEALKHLIDPKHMERLGSMAWSRFPSTKKLNELKSLTEDDFCQLVQNNVTFKVNCYFCNACCRSIRELDWVREHLQTDKHKEFIKIDFGKLIQTGIYFDFNFYKCRPCNSRFDNIFAANTHANSQTHLELTKVDETKLDLKKEKDQEIVELLVDDVKEMIIHNSENQTLSDEITEMMKRNLLDDIVFTENEIKTCTDRTKKNCLACQRVIPFNTVYEHIIGAPHLENLHKMKLKDNICEIKDKRALVSYFYCSVCDFWFEKNETLLQCHTMFHLHSKIPELKYDIIKFEFEGNNVTFKCLLCNYKMSSDDILAEHIQSIEHLEQLQSNLLTKGTKYVKKLTFAKLRNLFTSVKVESTTFSAKQFIFLRLKCSCFHPTTEDYNYIDEFKQEPLNESHSKDHIEGEYEEILPQKFKCYKCFLCDKSLIGPGSLVNHYLQDDHMYRYKNFRNRLKKIENSASGKSDNKKSTDPSRKTVLVDPNCVKPSNQETKKTTRDFNRMTDYFYCKICKFYILREPISHVQDHCTSHLYKDHPGLLDDIITFRSNEQHSLVIICLVCNVKMHHSDRLKLHLEKETHQKKVKAIVKNRDVEHDEKACQQTVKCNPSSASQSFQPKTDFSLESICLECYELKKTADGCNYLFEPNPAPNHQHKVEESKKSQDITPDMAINFYKCYLCNQIWSDKESLFSHYKNNKKHIRGIVRLRDILKLRKEKDSKKRSMETKGEDDNNEEYPINDDEEDEDEDDDEDDDEEEEEEEESKKIKRFKRERRAPKADDRVLHPYNVDILEYGSTFISKCIEPGSENIYTFDKEEVDLMKLGLSVIFLTDTSKCFCLACYYEVTLDPQTLFEHLQHENHVKNLNDLKDYEPDMSPSYFEMSQASFMEKSEKEIKCIACDQSMDNTTENLNYHLSKSVHKRKLALCKEKMDEVSSKLFELLDKFWYHATNFFCVICKLEITSEFNFVRHLEQPVHQAIANLDDKTYKVNKCLACFSCWYGIDSYTDHCNDYFHNMPRHRNSLNLPKLDKKSEQKLNDLKDLVRVTHSLIQESDKVTYRESHKETQLLQDIEFTVEHLYPRARAYTFGSRSSCLGLTGSDVDVFLDLENVYHQRGSKAASQKYIRRVNRQFFLSNKMCWKKDKILLNPRVPIIKLEHRQTRLKCDLSFMNGLGVEKSQLIRKFVVAYKGCREMILYLKKWFAAIKLYGPRGINAYAITWFTIFYLQSLEIFPSVHKLKESSNSRIVDGWECGFQKVIPVGANASNYTFQDLLKGFFRFYANFDFYTYVVSPLSGKREKKSDFVSIDKMPAESEIYKNRLKVEELEYFRFDSPMCIQDPVDLSQNITKAMKKKQLNVFILYCKMKC